MRFVSIAAFAIACGGENKLNAIDGTNGGNGGAIEVTPLSLNFGQVSSADAEGTIESFLIFGKGTKTSKVSTFDSKPHSLNLFAAYSAFCLLHGEPTWCGFEDMCFIQVSKFSGFRVLSNSDSSSL